jgi:ComF family protein
MNILQFILDTVIPPDPLIRAIEIMSTEDFLAKAGSIGAVEMSPDVISFFPYRNEVVRTALIEIKTRFNKKIIRLLGKVLCQKLIPLAEGRPLLIPIPMTKKSMRERGWNQCELLVKAIVTEDKGVNFEICTDELVKARKKEDQVGKGRKETFENLRGCFAVKDIERVRGRNVMVLDDIVTTGATLEEARRALTAAGVKKIILASVAH